MGIATATKAVKKDSSKAAKVKAPKIDKVKAPKAAAKAAKSAKSAGAAKPVESKVVKVAKAVVDGKRVPVDKRTEGAEARVLAILTSFGQPMLRSEITQRMTLWTREARDTAIDNLAKKKKIRTEVIGAGRRGRPGQQLELAA